VEQVNGVKAELQLPVVWAVAKGYFIKKLILVSSVLLISVFLLVIGGLYRCFEGVEKLAHKLMYTNYDLEQEHIKSSLLLQILLLS
jgi:predicted DNA repair protein MutK